MELLALTTLLSLLFAVITAYYLGFRPIKPTTPSKKRLQRNIRLYQSHQADLINDLHQGYLTTEDYQKLRTEAARQLLKTADNIQSPPKRASKKRTAIIIFAWIPFLAYPLYQYLGASTDLAIQAQLQGLQSTPSAAAFAEKVTDLQQSIDTRLDQRPDNLDYRLLAARFAMTQGDYTKAENHFRVIVELLPDDPEALTYLAQASFLAQGRTINDSTYDLLKKALSINPQQPTALSLLGMHAFEQEQYQTAIDHWSTLLAQLPPHDEQASIIQKGIEKAKQAQGKAQGANHELSATHEHPAASLTSAHIQVTVNLADTLPLLAADTPVFIYAKAINGPPMPLAVQKLTVGALPVTIRLDDRHAMTPTMTLSQYDDVQVTARVAVSRNPIAQTGDWQSSSVVVSTDQGSASLVIDHQR